MPNYDPKPHLIPYRMKPEGSEAFHKRQLQVKLPKSLREALDYIPPKKRNQLIRQWISEGFSRYQERYIEHDPPPESESIFECEF